jgi:hemerythrin-like domain-containing protein
VQLGHAQDAAPAELSLIAARVTRYFTLGLPQHIEDEDYTVLPCLFTTTLAPDQLQLLWELGHQHEEIEQLVERLVPLWATVRDTPQRYAELAEPLAKGGRQLLMLMEEHLTLEEQTLFPLIRSRFSQATLLKLATDIADRRRQLT